MIYSENIKLLARKLTEDKLSAEEIADTFSSLFLDNNNLDFIHKTLQKKAIFFTSADWQILLKHVPEPKTIRTWIKVKQVRNNW